MPENYTKKYDLIVIGAGSAGLSMALAMHKFEFKVLLIDKKAEHIGGDCLNFGCVPSKALIHVSRQINASKSSAGYGLDFSGKVDLAKVMDYVKSRQEIIRAHENKEYFEKQGLDIEIGETSFKDKQLIEVGDKTFFGKKIIIATGSRPRKLEIAGAKNANIITNMDVFDLKTLAENLVVVGGGPIGIEMAQAFQRLGSNVTIIQRGKEILEKEDPEISKILLQNLKEEGIKVVTETKPVSISDNVLSVKSLNSDKEQKLKFDLILSSIGRELNHGSLQLDKAGVNTKDGKIVVNDKLRTTNKHVFVCGDAVGSLMFSHAAELHARIILNNFFSPLKKKLTYKKFSWTTFSDPEIATFGLSAAQLEEVGKAYEKLVLDFDGDDRAVIEGYQYGKLILYISKKTLFNWSHKILGGSMVAPRAGELIQELVTCMEANNDLNVLFNKIYAYPTASRVNQKIVMQKRSGQLTDKLKKLLRMIY